MTLSRKINRISLLVSVVVCVLSAAITQAQAADREEGLWQPASCGNAVASFIDVPKGKGFGHGTLGGQLVKNSVDAGTAGLTLSLRPLTEGEFAYIHFAVSMQNTVTAQNTNVHFCFSNGQTFDRTLSELLYNRQKVGWQHVVVPYGELDKIRSSLIKVTFSLPKQGMLIVGDTLIRNLGPESGIIPVSLRLDTADCSYLTNCTTPWSQ